MRLIITVFIFLTNNVFAGVIIGKDSILHSKFSGRAFIISIGIDDYKSNKIGNLSFCKSDADYFIKYLKKDTIIKDLILFKFRDDSNKEDIISAFNEIQKKSTKEDLFIFYFSGHSFDKNLILPNDKIPYNDIIYFSQNTYAERQLFISDANDGLEFGLTFKNFLKEKPLEKLATKTDRILISLKSISMELQKGANLMDSLFAGGQLTGGISNSRFPLTSIFNSHSDRFWTEFKYEIYKAYKNETNFPDIFIFSEQDYLAEIKKETNRGIIVEVINNNEGEKTIFKKGETLSIIVGNQNFEKLPRLPNVMNDITKINLILNERYKTNTLLLKDISYKTFRDTLNFIKQTYTFEEGSQILFISASHGLKDNFGLGYLCFTDTKTDDNITSFELQTLKRVISSFGATNSLMIMDICHSSLAFEENNCTSPTSLEIPLNSPIFKSSFNQSSPAYKNFLNQESNLYFGSSRDQEAADGSGPNSPFATVIISFLESNKLPVIDSYHLKKSIEEKIMEEGAISFPTFCSYNCKPDGRFLFIRK